MNSSMKVTGARIIREKVAVIVEPRKHRCTAFIFQQYDKVLSDGWHFVIFAGTENDTWMKMMADRYITRKTHTWEVITMPVANLTKETYSYLLTSVDFWTRVPGEHVLIFQMDTIPLPGSPYKPEDFFEYDWVGAPWRPGKDKWLESTFQGKPITVGNGGLSLRKRSSSIAICRGIKPNSVIAEDVHFSRLFYNHPNYRVAPRDAAGCFAAELVLLNPHPFGLHYPGGLPEFRDLCLKFPTLQQWLNTHLSPQPETYIQLPKE